MTIEEETRQMKKNLAARRKDGLEKTYCEFCGGDLPTHYESCPLYDGKNRP